MPAARRAAVCDLMALGSGAAGNIETERAVAVPAAEWGAAVPC